MRFEILGAITDVETFATGAGIREIARLRRIYGRGRWRKRKGNARIDWPMALPIKPNYTGMKPLESGVKNTKSNTLL